MKGAPAAPVAWWDWSWVVLSALLFTLAQPPLDLGFVAWVALVPLLAALEGKTSRQRLHLGFAFGMLCSWSIAGYWLASAFHQVPFGWITSGLLAQATIGVSGVVGLTAFAWLCRDWRSTRLPVLWIPATWVAIEYARTNVIFGTPWCLMGHSQFSYPAVIQIADLAGVYGVSFVLCTANVALASLAATSHRGMNLGVGGALVAFCIAYGGLRLGQSLPAAETVSIQAVYPAWSSDHDLAPGQRLAGLIRISEQAPADPSALLVWPENALRFHLHEDGELSEAFTSFVQARRQYLVAGLHRYEREQRRVAYYNSAVLVAPEGSIIGVADKRMLLPVAEARWPLLPSVEQPFTQGKAWVPLSAGKRKIGILMCFESIFPGPSRALVQQGAELLVNPTNDEILGPGAAQLAAMSVFRSVENRVPLVHAATAGVTQIVDHRGRIVALATRSAQVVAATLPSGRIWTWYNAVGDLFAQLCVAAALLARWGRGGGARAIRGQ